HQTEPNPRPIFGHRKDCDYHRTREGSKKEPGRKRPTAPDATSQCLPALFQFLADSEKPQPGQGMRKNFDVIRGPSAVCSSAPTSFHQPRKNPPQELVTVHRTIGPINDWFRQFFRTGGILGPSGFKHRLLRSCHRAMLEPRPASNYWLQKEQQEYQRPRPES